MACFPSALWLCRITSETVVSRAINQFNGHYLAAKMKAVFTPKHIAPKAQSLRARRQRRDKEFFIYYFHPLWVDLSFGDVLFGRLHR